MQCGNCRNDNDADALFCEYCGRDLTAPSLSGSQRKGRTALYGLIAAVVIVVAAVGYYKFFVPTGVAAVVNGEEILLAEIDGRMQGVANNGDIPAEVLSRARYRVLNDLITERIAWQEARKAGIRVPSKEVTDSYEQLVRSSGGDRGAFDALIKAQYGSQRVFLRSLERRIAIKRYIDESIAAGETDPTIISGRVNQWLQDISGSASVRVALAEQLPGANGGCGSGQCGSAGSAGCGGSGAAGGCGSAPRTGKDVSPQAKEARKAALAYWKKQYGDEAIEAKVLDFGCHIQVDMMKGKQLARSLRYQNGTISEL